MRGDVSITIRKRLLNCYVFSVLIYGCKSWTVNKSLIKRMHAFEQCCYWRMLKISWKEVSKTDVLKRVREKELLQANSTTETRICWTVGHIKGSGGRNTLVILIH